MIVAQEVVNAFNVLSALLQRPELELSPKRTDWSAVAGLLDEVRQGARAAVDGLKALDDAKERSALGEEGAWILARAGALLCNAGRREGANLIRAASDFDSESVALRYGRQDPDGFIRLSVALELRADGHSKASDAMLQTLAKERPNPDLMAVIDGLRSIGVPLKSAPPLFTFNSVGTGLYGHRDEAPDGSYVATLCICALFIPLIPLAAYRVESHGGGQYSFYSKVSLSRFASMIRNAIVVLGLGAVGAGIFSATYYSPSRQAGRDFDSAAVQAEGQAPKDAVETWRSYLELPHADAAPDLQAKAALSLVDGLIAQVPNPLTAQDEAAVQAAARDYGALPSHCRDTATAERFVTAMVGWADALEDPAAKTRVLGDALRLIPSTRTAGLRTVKAQVAVALAGLLRFTDPLRALELYCAAPEDAGGRAGSIEMLQALVAWRALLHEEQAMVQACLQSLGVMPDTEGIRDAVSAALQAEAKVVADPEREALLAGRDFRALRKHLRTYPDDAGVRLAVAGMTARERDMAGAEAVLLEGTSVPWLTRSAQTLLAQIWARLGRRIEAEDLLERQVERGLPQLQAARRAYLQKHRSIEQRLSRTADRGEAPPHLQKLLYGDDDEAARQAYGEWVREHLASDEVLAALRDDYARQATLVTVALDLGRMKLERANAASGAERSELLSQAERTFLAVQQESQGEPDYHISLGTVYYRLEKRPEGDREFAHVLTLGDSVWALRVARAYRRLGLEAKAREICEKEYASGQAQSKDAAAALMFHLAESLEDRELWLGRVVSKSLGVKANLASLRAERAIRDGDESAAAKAYDEAYRLWASLGDVDASALNNAALSLRNKFSYGGDIGDVHRSAKALERAARLDPDAPLIALNYLEALWTQARVEAFSKWIRPKEFQLEGSTAWSLIYALHAGGEKAWVEQLLKAPLTTEIYGAGRRARTLAPARLAGYGFERSAAGVTRDLATVQALLNTAQRSLPADRAVEPSDPKARAAALPGWLKLSRDRLQRAKSRQARAAAQVELAKALENQGELEFSAEAFTEAVQAIQEAERLWPALDYSRRRAGLLLGGAVVAGLKDQPKLRQRYLDEDWDDFPRWFLLQLSQEGGHEATVGRIVSHPGAQEALRIIKAEPTPLPRLQAWALGKALNDEALAAAHTAAFSEPYAVALQSLDHHLRNSVASRAVWALTEAHRPQL